MFKKRFVAVSAAAMLGISTITVPTIASADVIGSTGKLGEGEYIARGDIPFQKRDYTTYDADGNEFARWPMELRPRMSGGAQAVDRNCEPNWDWWTVTQRGGTTTPYSFEWEAISVMDAELQSPSTNGFLQNFASNSLDSIGGAMNHFVSADGQTASWRMQVISAEDLFNVTMNIKPSSLQAPPVPAAGDGQSGVRVFNGDVVDGGGNIIPGNLYNSPRDSDGFDVAYNSDLGANEILGEPYMPGTSVPSKTGPLVYWKITENEDGSWDAYIPYFPAGAHAVVQFNQAIDKENPPEHPPFATAVIKGDRFSYPATEVPQGTERDVVAPTDPDNPNAPEGTVFKRIDETPDNPEQVTPEWVQVAEDGSLTVAPGYDVPVDEFHVPVPIDYPDDVENPLLDGIVWAPVNVVGTPLYDDAFTTPGTPVIVNPNNEASLPAGSTYAVGEAPGGFEVSINPDNGQLTITPPEDADEGTDEGTVTATSPQGDEWNIPVRVLVSNEIVDARVDDAGNLIVTYANGDEKDLGPVGDRVEIAEAENEDGESGYTITVTGADGSTQEVFIREGLDGNTPYIGENGNWWIGEEDTGLPARGEKGEKGESVTIETQETDENGGVTLTFSDGTEVVVSAGEDGTSVEISEIVTDEETGTVTVEFSDGKSITIPRGEKGEKGDTGAAGESTTITGSAPDPETGETVVTFSDGSEVRIPAPERLTVTGSEQDEEGNTVVTFSDGSTNVIPKAKDGVDGKDGKNADALTITGQATDADGNTVVSFSVGSSVTIPSLTVKEQQTDDEGNVTLTLSDDSEIVIAAGKDGQNGRNGKDAVALSILSQEPNEDGDIVVTFSNGRTLTVPAGESITVEKQEIDEAGNVTVSLSDGTSVTVRAGRDGEDAGQSFAGQEMSSDVPSTCLPAGLSVGLPLLLLLLIGVASQLDIPGLSPLMGQVNAEIAKINSGLQQQIGIFDGGQAGFASQFNGVAGQAAQVGGAILGGAVAVGLGLLVADYLAKNCSPEGKGFLFSNGGSSTDSEGSAQ